jgi:hypothetical protein
MEAPRWGARPGNLAGLEGKRTRARLFNALFIDEQFCSQEGNQGGAMKQHVVIYKGNNGYEVNPATLEVEKGHLVVWYSNINKAFKANNFRLRNPPGPKLFAEDEIPIPLHDEGQSSAVLPTPGPGTKWIYDYDITDSTGHTITFRNLKRGRVIDPVIIVDPPGGTPDILDRDVKKQRKNQRKKQGKKQGKKQR